MESRQKIENVDKTLFWKNVKKTRGCWNWVGCLNYKGYGRFFPPCSSGFFAHRLSYTFLVGDIPKGKFIDHLCRNRKCVNPKHLRVVTNKENMFAEGSRCIAAINKAKTECKRGHPLSGKNLRVHKGQRQCYACVHNNIRRQRKMKLVAPEIITEQNEKPRILPRIC